MAHWPLPSAAVFAEPEAITTSAWTLRTLTASATPHTKGAYTEIDAAIPAAVKGIIVGVRNTSSSGANTSMLMDIAIGAAASEVVVVANLGIGYRIAGTEGAVWSRYIPLCLPGGVRLAARIQAAVVSDTAETFWHYHRGQGLHPARSFTVCETMGADTATSRGVTLTASGTANTKGAWAQIVASTPAQTHALFPTVQMAGATAVVASTRAIDIGVGGAGAEQVLFPDFISQTGGTAETESERYLLYLSELLDVNIPAGTRLSARVASSIASQTCDVILHGFRR